MSSCNRANPNHYIFSAKIYNWTLLFNARNAILTQHHRKDHFLLDTGAPKTICNESWIKRANWTSSICISLPQNLPPLRFAGHPLHALCGIFLAASESDIQSNAHELRLFALVFSDVPIPLLLGLQDRRRPGFEVCLRTGDASHHEVSQWGSTHHLTITSHVHLSFKLQPVSVVDHHDFKYVISSALLESKSASPFPVFTLTERTNSAAFDPIPFSQFHSGFLKTGSRIRLLKIFLPFTKPSNILNFLYCWNSLASILAFNIFQRMYSLRFRTPNDANVTKPRSSPAFLSFRSPTPPPPSPQNLMPVSSFLSMSSLTFRNIVEETYWLC